MSAIYIETALAARDVHQLIVLRKKEVTQGLCEFDEKRLSEISSRLLELNGCEVVELFMKHTPLLVKTLSRPS